MSSILDAIKRSEEQRDRGAAIGGQRPAVRAASRRERRLTAGVLVGLLVSLLIAAVSLFAFLPKESKENDPHRLSPALSDQAPTVDSPNEVATQNIANGDSEGVKDVSDTAERSNLKRSQEPRQRQPLQAEEAGSAFGVNAGRVPVDEAQGHTEDAGTGKPQETPPTRESAPSESALRTLRPDELGISVTAYVYSNQNDEAFLLSSGRRFGINEMLIGDWRITDFRPDGPVIDNHGERRLLKLR